MTSYNLHSSDQAMIDEEILRFSNRYEGLAQWELTPPMDLKMEIDEQIDYIAKNLRIKSCNQTFAEMYGHDSVASVEGTMLFDFWENREFTNRIVEIFVKKSFQISNLETCEENENGQCKWFLNFGKPIIRDEKLTGLWTTQIDITRRKELELELTKSQNHLDAVMQNSSDIILSIDRNYRLLTINRAAQMAFEGAFGVTAKPNDNILEIIPEFLVPVWKERYDRALSGESFSVDDHYIDGELELFFDLSFYPIWKGEEVISASVISRNITDRKLNELRLEQSEKKYRAIAADKEKLLQSMRSYTFHTSHILRSPITNILGIADLLLTYEMDFAELKRILYMVVQESKRLDGIVREMSSSLDSDNDEENS